MGPRRYAVQNCAGEWSYSSGKSYADPFNEVELDIVFTDPAGANLTAPAFWAGGQTWRVRFAPRTVGDYRFRTVCSDQGNPDLHGQEGELIVTPYTGDNPLLKHGPLRVGPSRRHLEHLDGAPFFWLGDTWWMGLCHRLRWPDDFRLLLADRLAKGFTVIQIVAGLYPDMPPFDERGANEAGFPWEADYRRINPAYFDLADLRIEALIRAGLVPCIVGCWGYFIRWMGLEQMKRHWRNLIARYGAYPVVWCLAGEATMPYYLSKDREADVAIQRREWTRIAAYVRQTDPYHHPITIHPTVSARDQLEDPALLDIDMLQTGHSDRESLASTVSNVVRSVAQEPSLPTINGEVCYEGIIEASRQEVQRLMFWTCLLSGAAGHTYGANGIWQVNTRERPFGPSPHGFSWGDTPWEEAYQLPGSAQVALGKRLLERYEWWRFEPHPEWVRPHWSAENYFLPYAAGVSGEVRVVYFPLGTGRRWRTDGFTITGLESGSAYRAFFVNPTNGREYPIGTVEGGPAGDWPVPDPPIFQDWVLVLERFTN